ncbi:SprB repeat-containing protein [bacterium]|nr:SprB repeat-containing protein [bacterium]
MEILINENINGNNVTCFGGNDGKAIVTVVGGNWCF